MIMLTLQSRACFLAIVMAAFLSLSDSKVSTYDSPFLTCQNNDLAAALPSPLAPHSYIPPERKVMHVVILKISYGMFITPKVTCIDGL